MSLLLDSLGQIVILLEEIKIGIDEKYKIKSKTDQIYRIIRNAFTFTGGRDIWHDCNNYLSNLSFSLNGFSSKEPPTVLKEIGAFYSKGLILIKAQKALEEDLFDYWKKEIQTRNVYSGTSSLSVPQIKRYGIIPSMRPPFWQDIGRMFKLYKKSNHENPLNLFHNMSIEGDWLINQGIFVTPIYTSACNYAKKAPAIWHEFISNRNYKEAKKYIFFEAFFNNLKPGNNVGNSFFFAYLSRMNLPDSSRTTENFFGWVGNIRNECYEVYDKNPDKAYDSIKKLICPKHEITITALCPLSIREINELMAIFNRLWIEFKDAKPILLQISVLAPAVAEDHYFTDIFTEKSWVLDFEGFLNNFLSHVKSRKFFGEKTLKEQKREFLDSYFLDTHIATQILIKKSIPKNFVEILEIE